MWIQEDEVLGLAMSRSECNDMKGCCDFLYKINKERWLKEEEVIDDIILILVFFE